MLDEARNPQGAQEVMRMRRTWMSLVIVALLGLTAGPVAGAEAPETGADEAEDLDETILETYVQQGVQEAKNEPRDGRLYVASNVQTVEIEFDVQVNGPIGALDIRSLEVDGPDQSRIFVELQTRVVTELGNEREFLPGSFAVFIRLQFDPDIIEHVPRDVYSFVNVSTLPGVVELEASPEDPMMAAMQLPWSETFKCKKPGRTEIASLSRNPMELRYSGEDGEGSTSFDFVSIGSVEIVCEGPPSLGSHSTEVGGHMMEAFGIPGKPIKGTVYPIRLCVTDENGDPVPGVRAYLTFAESRKKAGDPKATHNNAVTGADGCVTLKMKVKIAPGKRLVVLTGLDGEPGTGEFPVDLEVGKRKK
jgi:hypothetical protein